MIIGREVRQVPGEKDFGLTVAKLREEQEWSQEKLGAEAGLSRQAINNIENGAIPKIDKVKPLCKALNVSPNELFEYEGKPQLGLSGLEDSLVSAITMFVDVGKNMSVEKQKQLAEALKIQIKLLT